jgi:polysaccharide deacetylase 2 family uncharacterized protein YibQ
VLYKIPIKILIGAAVFLSAVLIGIAFGTGFGKSEKKQEPEKQELAPEATKDDILLLNKNLKKMLNVHRDITLKYSKTDTLSANEVWLVPNGMSIPNYMLRASREIERCKGKIHWMREIRDGRAALIKYEGEQGVYPLTEIRIIDTLWLPNSSKLAVVLAVREQNKILKDNPELLEKLNFRYSLLIPSSRPEFLEAGKRLNSKIIPWVPMEGRVVYNAERKSQIPIGVASEKELALMLDEAIKKFDKANGFASLYGEDFLVHAASVEKFGNVLASKNLWFWDLSKRGTASLSPNECAKKDIRCRKDYLDAESEALIAKSLRTARLNGKATLLFELTEKSLELLQKLPGMAEKQGTSLVYAEEVF